MLAYKEIQQSMLGHLDEHLQQYPDDQAALKKRAKWAQSFFDCSSIEETAFGPNRDEPLFDSLYELIESRKMFLPYNLYLACKDLLLPDVTAHEPDGTFRLRRFKLKPGVVIHVKAS